MLMHCGVAGRGGVSPLCRSLLECCDAILEVVDGGLLFVERDLMLVGAGCEFLECELCVVVVCGLCLLEVCEVEFGGVDSIEDVAVAFVDVGLHRAEVIDANLVDLPCKLVNEQRLIVERCWVGVVE